MKLLIFVKICLFPMCFGNEKRALFFLASENLVNKSGVNMCLLIARFLLLSRESRLC